MLWLLVGALHKTIFLKVLRVNSYYSKKTSFNINKSFLASDTLNQVRLPIQGAATCPIHFLPSFQFCAGNVVLDKDTCNVSIKFIYLLKVRGDIG